jgi:hypothetical protein
MGKSNLARRRLPTSGASVLADNGRDDGDDNDRMVTR